MLPCSLHGCLLGRNIATINIWTYPQNKPPSIIVSCLSFLCATCVSCNAFVLFIHNFCCVHFLWLSNCFWYIFKSFSHVYYQPFSFWVEEHKMILKKEKINWTFCCFLECNPSSGIKIPNFHSILELIYSCHF